MLIIARRITESRDGGLKPVALNPARLSESNEYHYAHERVPGEGFDGCPWLVRPRGGKGGGDWTLPGKSWRCCPLAGLSGRGCTNQISLKSATGYDVEHARTVIEGVCQVQFSRKVNGPEGAHDSPSASLLIVRSSGRVSSS